MIHDSDIREPLFDFLEDTYGKTRIIEEKMMGRSRADMVMVTESFLYGIEIKSDADTYSRLSRQIKDYDRYFDRNMIVVGTTHAMSVCSHVPGYWGIITVEEVEGILDFYMLRHPSDNPKMKQEYKLSVLWRPELAHLLAINGLPKYAQTSKKFVIEKLISSVEKEKLSGQLCEELFQRDYTTISETISEYKRKHKR